MNKEALLIATFFVTATYDVILQRAEKDIPFLHEYLKDTDWYVSLTKKGGYFDKIDHALAAALLAGFIGFATQIFILHFQNFPTKFSAPKTIFKFFVLTFIMSAIAGIPIKKSNMFPKLSETYYQDLGLQRSMITDGMSGVVVNATIFVLLSTLK